MLNDTNLNEIEKHIQDIYAEIRYLVHVIEGVANTMKRLIPEE